MAALRDRLNARFAALMTAAKAVCHEDSTKRWSIAKARNSLIWVTGLSEWGDPKPSTPSSFADYMKQIAVCARCIASEADYKSGAYLTNENTLDEIIGMLEDASRERGVCPTPVLSLETENGVQRIWARWTSGPRLSRIIRVAEGREVNESRGSPHAMSGSGSGVLNSLGLIGTTPESGRVYSVYVILRAVGYSDGVSSPLYLTYDADTGTWSEAQLEQLATPEYIRDPSGLCIMSAYEAEVTYNFYVDGVLTLQTNDTYPGFETYVPMDGEAHKIAITAYADGYLESERSVPYIVHYTGTMNDFWSSGWEEGEPGDAATNTLSVPYLETNSTGMSVSSSGEGYPADTTYNWYKDGVNFYSEKDGWLSLGEPVLNDGEEHSITVTVVADGYAESKQSNAVYVLDGAYM